MVGSTEIARGKRPSPRAALRQTFRALRNRNYRLFWSGQVISSVGTWMQRIALAWLVLKLTNSPLDLGLVTTFQTLPVLLFALFGGVIADRVAKRRLLLVTQTTMLLQASVLALMTAAGFDNLYAIYLLAAILGTANALDNPARQAFVKELVGPDDVANAVALNSIVFNTARLIGPALGGVTIAAIGVTGCFTLNALSFLAVLGGLILMRPADFYELARPPRGKVLRQIAEGVNYAVRTPDIALVLLLMLVIGTFGYNFTVILPLIATYVLHAGPVGFGTLTSAMAIGSLLAAVGIAYSGRVSQRTLLAGAGGFSGLLLLLAISDRWPTTVAILIALGFASIVFTATANSRLQLLAPPELRGRVMSLYTLLFLGSTPIGSLVIGTLADHQGVRLAVGELALICWVGVIAGLVYLHRQRARRPAPAPEGIHGAPAPVLAAGESGSPAGPE
ncbi:MAG TPA: MFS transporter [Thermomicrobiaceae bacterium]|nr:MFS transporter [Thermomicrobiaceae bacterium]